MSALTYLGGVSVGALVPGIMPVYAGVLAELQARLTLTPPTLAANLELAIAMVANLAAAISLGMPGIDFQVSACLQVIAELYAKIQLLLGLPFATAGVELYAYDGRAVDFGPLVTAQIGGGLGGGAPVDQMWAIIAATRFSATWDAMGLVLKTS